MSVNSYSFHFQPGIQVESYVNIFIGSEYECEKILLTKLNLKIDIMPNKEYGDLQKTKIKS